MVQKSVMVTGLAGLAWADTLAAIAAIIRKAVTSSPAFLKRMNFMLHLTKHIPELLDLWQATPNVGLSSADTPELIEFITHNPITCFVAIEDSRVVGSAMGGYDGRRGYVYHLAVRKEFQGRGLG